MTARDLVRSLSVRGVGVMLEPDGNLSIRHLPGVLTAADLGIIRDHKSEIVALLTPEPATDPLEALEREAIEAEHLASPETTTFGFGFGARPTQLPLWT